MPVQWKTVGVKTCWKKSNSAVPFVDTNEKITNFFTFSWQLSMYLQNRYYLKTVENNLIKHK